MIIPGRAGARSRFPARGTARALCPNPSHHLNSNELTIEAPTEVATYIKAFSRLQELAVYGAEARALITSAIEALG